MVAKIKALRLKYRVALDSGRKSGGGGVVAQFYDTCSKRVGQQKPSKKVLTAAMSRHQSQPPLMSQVSLHKIRMMLCQVMKVKAHKLLTIIKEIW